MEWSLNHLGIAVGKHGIKFGPFCDICLNLEVDCEQAIEAGTYVSLIESDEL